jgi:hypothetical protein
MSDDIKKLFGVEYYEPGTSAVITAPDNDLYYYECFIGEHEVSIQRGDCAYWISEDGNAAHITRGEATIKSPRMAAIIRGYMPENKQSDMNTLTCLPYINGCSSKQIFPPDRLGDPTLQMLYMPPHTSEQAHHIHPTVRIVYVQQGHGYSLVGMHNKSITEELYPGKIIVLDKMCPHHFKTEDKSLTVIPLHVWSSVPGIEKNHPMFNGTHQI